MCCIRLSHVGGNTSSEHFPILKSEYLQALTLSDDLSPYIRQVNLFRQVTRSSGGGSVLPSDANCSIKIRLRSKIGQPVPVNTKKIFSIAVCIVIQRTTTSVCTSYNHLGVITITVVACLACNRRRVSASSWLEPALSVQYIELYLCRMQN